MAKTKRVFERKIYTDLDEYQRDWLAAFAQAGHKPALHEDAGRVDSFAYTSGSYHNGPCCTECGEGWCWHCTAPWEIAECKCGGKAHKEKVEREAEDHILAQADAIRERRRKARDHRT